MPLGWEGPSTQLDIATLADMYQWINQATANYSLFRDNPTVYVKDAAVDCLRQVLRNAWRILRQLGIQDAPPQPPEPAHHHEAEREIGNLQQWILARLEQSATSPDSRDMSIEATREIARDTEETPKTHTLESGVRAEDPRPFTGGVMEFFPSCVKLCGIDICSGPRSENARTVFGTSPKSGR